MRYTSGRCKCEYCTDLKSKYRNTKNNKFTFDGRIKTVKTYIKDILIEFNQTIQL